MNIGMIVNNLEVSGGYQKLVIRLSQELQKTGHKVTVYSPKVDRKQCYPKDIKTLNIVTLSPEQAEGTPAVVYQHLILKMDDQLDALIIHDELSLVGVALLSNKPKKIIWMLNNQLPEDIGLYAKEAQSVYRQTVGPLKTRLKETKKAVNRVGLIRQGLRAVTDFVTYDEFNKQLVRQKLKRSATVVSAGADLDSFKKYAKERTFGKKRTYMLLSVGVLFPHRRYEDLIQAIPYLKAKGVSVKVVIVGRQTLAPEYYGRLVDLTKKHAVTKEVEFKDFVTDEAMVKLYKNSDAFVFINDGFTWGISVFEAVAARLPVIITDNIGAADLVKNNESGWIVKPRSPQQVAEAVSDIILHRDKSKEIANRAYDELTPFVSWQAYMKRMLAVLEK